MGRINVLDKHVAELIAAGEVVERPSSVIKELVENSIDAGATKITVEIKNGGTTFMRVSDNGHGIERDDIKNAFLRHATSKVKIQDDLDSIKTLGFRGEALASVCAVANIELITCADTEDVGTSYVMSAGEEISFCDAGCPKGTTIIVRDLFFNIPARQKFLKKDISEGNSVAQVIDRIALSHPEISFTFIRDSKQTLKTPGDNNLKSAVYSVFGRDFANSLIEVNYSLGGISVTGYLAKPEGARASRSMQTFFVNNRYVKTRTAAAALDEAAKGSVMTGKFLPCVLNISLSFSAVDVNVHPAKIEVRFVNERPIFDAVYHAVKSALLSIDEHKKAQLFTNTKPVSKIEPFTYSTVSAKSNDVANKHSESVNYKSSPFKTATPFSSTKLKFSENSATVNDFQTAKNNYLSSIELISEDNKRRNSDLQIFEEVEVKETETENVKITLTEDTIKPHKDILISDEPENLISAQLEQNKETQFKFIGEFLSTYILVEIKNSLMVIDKHALHERIIYERLKKDYKTFRQILLAPVTVSLPKDEYNACISNRDMLLSCGFETEDFGNGIILVRSAPQYLDASDIETSISEMAGYLLENKLDIKTEKMDWVYHSVACRAAVKAGNKSSSDELISLVKEMLSSPELKHCPHGRPVCIEITKNEIEKQFGRV